MKQCCICWAEAKGKQRHNRDNWFWICKRCAKEEKEKLSEQEMISHYGIEWVNFELTELIENWMI